MNRLLNKEERNETFQEMADTFNEAFGLSQKSRLESLQRYSNISLSYVIARQKIDAETQERNFGNEQMQRLYNYKVSCLAEKQAEELKNLTS